MSYDHSFVDVLSSSRDEVISEHRDRAADVQVAAYIDAYRRDGYRIANLDPLGFTPTPDLPTLSRRYHGLDRVDALLPDSFATPSIRTVRDLDARLKSVYCGTLTLDSTAVRSENTRQWLYSRMERGEAALSQGERLHVLERLYEAQAWENLVAARFEHRKRFSLEGCESLIPLLDALIEGGARYGVTQVFMAMPHRGRLNVLVNVMEVAASVMLARMDAGSDAARVMRDLAYHLGGRVSRKTPHGEVSIGLAFNPSHLESVYPVLSGMARAYNDEHPGAEALPIIMHGDAAFAGQGIVPETLNLTQRSGYGLGGTIHIIINNQIGFTTPNRMNAVSGTYCTDVARMIDAPVIRVNADHVEDVLHAAAIALDYRVEHGRDIIIDLVGYRRLGHSEHDIPAITQPFLHTAISSHPVVADLYHARVGVDSSPDLMRQAAEGRLLGHGEVRSVEADVITDVEPNADVSLPMSSAHLRQLADALTRVPTGVIVHELIRETTTTWRETFDRQREVDVDWCLAENLAYASLLEEGHDIRISGMDVERGTFLHRHAVWHAQDYLSGVNNRYLPLMHIAVGQGRFDIVNSPLTEAAVLGFEYGYSVETSNCLTIWEAQYGDFANGAQVFFDQFIAPGEYKWSYRSSLIVMLPHGHEGVGPEHSNAWLGRFLQLCADDNLRVVVPSTSAQWFHLLRQQAKAKQRKPMIVMSPKSQLYGNRRSHKGTEELVATNFQPVLGDQGVDSPETVKRLVLCYGKFFYDIEAARTDDERVTTAIVRVEQLYPFPADELKGLMADFLALEQVVWAQEEDVNHGAWRYVRDDLESILPEWVHLHLVSRAATASGAHASVTVHAAEQQELVRRVLDRLDD